MVDKSIFVCVCMFGKEPDIKEPLYMGKGEHLMYGS